MSLWINSLNFKVFHRYVEQLVASAQAAVDEVVKRGVCFDVPIPLEVLIISSSKIIDLCDLGSKTIFLIFPGTLSEGIIIDLLVHVLQVADRNKIAVGGHSYGAFMTANLLIHAPDLYSCGIARSGAYNRTLTPFGFQVCK